MVSDFPAWGHSPSLRPRDLIKVKKNKLKDWSFWRHQWKIYCFHPFLVIFKCSWTLLLIWKFWNNCFSKTALNQPNQSVIIGIIYKWLANNCLIMKWPDFRTTGYCSFQFWPLFIEKHPVLFYFTFSRSFIDTYFPIEVWVSPRFILSL